MENEQIKDNLIHFHAEDLATACNNYNQIHEYLTEIMPHIPIGMKVRLMNSFQGTPVIEVIK